MAAFETEVLVRFGHCDPGNIVYYPRYFEMINNAVEDWCRDGLGVDFRELLVTRNLGLPTAHFDVQFLIPGELGDILRFSLTVEKIGNSSVKLRHLVTNKGRDAIRVVQTLVFTDKATMRPCSIPSDMAERMRAFMAS